MNNDKVNYSDPQIIAERLLWPLWRGLDPGFKEKYLRDIWTQFENNIRSAAYTGSLSRFLNNITSRLGIEIQAQFLDDLNSILKSNQDKTILKTLRENSTLCVLFTRKLNEEQKSQFKNDV